MSRIFTSIFTLIIVSCNQYKSKYKTIDFGVFKLTTPSEWEKIKRKGIDSYVGGLTNGKDTLWFDYGWHDVSLDKSELPNKLAIDTVNGLVAEISVPTNSDTGFYSLYISKVNKSDKFTLYGANISEKEKILSIFKSLLFKESDTSKNPPLLEQKFSKSFENSGENLFKSNCANCHKLEHNYSGPSLKSRFSVRSREWVYLFLAHRDKLKDDLMRDSLEKEYQLKCMKYPEFSREEVFSIYNFCK